LKTASPSPMTRGSRSRRSTLHPRPPFESRSPRPLPTQQTRP
jgi:hypothetical protein